MVKTERLAAFRLPRLIAAAVLGAALAACQAPPPPVLAPFGDGVHWVLARNLRYTIADTGQTIVVPKGFITDLASIPRSLWSILSPIDNYLTAAIVHDYLYWDQRCTQLDADNVLYVGMLEIGVQAAKREAVYAGVRVGGKSAFLRNAALKKSGEARQLTPEFVEHVLDQPISAQRTWDVVKREAAAKRALVFADTANPDITAACAAATKVKAEGLPSTQ